jgi:hypothetical protein
MSEDEEVELEVCGGVELVEELLFGEVLLGEVLFGEVLVEEPVPVVELLPDVLLPALPEMLPAVLPVSPLLEELGLLAEPDPDIPEDAPAPALETSRLSFTFFTPATDFAIFFASFLSSLLATVPVSFTVPFSTSTCTFCRFGLAANCS